MGLSPRGSGSRFTARDLPTISTHCQSQFWSVGNSARARELVSHHKPSMRLHVGPMSAFQKIGTCASGGLHQLKSERRGVNNTFLPSASALTAWLGELVSTRLTTGAATGWLDG